MRLPALAGDTRIHTVPGRPPFMLIREIAEVIAMKVDTLQKAFRRNRGEFPLPYLVVLTDEEYGMKFGQNVRTSQGKRTDLGQVGLTEKGVLLLLTFVSGNVGIAGRIALIDSIFNRHEAETEALRSALIQDEAKFIGRSTVKAQIKLAALEGWSFARLTQEVTCSLPVLVRHVQAMRVRGFIPRDALLPPVYLLQDIAAKKAGKAAHLIAHETDARQLLLGLEG